jgi:hypothetical protein
LKGSELRSMLGFVIGVAAVAAAFTGVMYYPRAKEAVGESTLFALGVVLLALTNGVYYLIIRYCYRTRDLV